MFFKWVIVMVLRTWLSYSHLWSRRYRLRSCVISQDQIDLRLKVKLAFLLHYVDLLESIVNKDSKDRQPGKENQGCIMDHVRGLDYTIIQWIIQLGHFEILTTKRKINGDKFEKWWDTLTKLQGGSEHNLKAALAKNYEQETLPQMLGTHGQDYGQ